jgi:hypothetical protein
MAQPDTLARDTRDTLIRARQQVAANIEPDVLDQLARDGIRTFAAISAEVLRSPIFHVYQATMQAAAAGDVAAKFLKQLHRHGEVKFRDLVTVEDYVRAVGTQPLGGGIDNGTSRGQSGRDAPSRESYARSGG